MAIDHRDGPVHLADIKSTTNGSFVPGRSPCKSTLNSKIPSVLCETGITFDYTQVMVSYKWQGLAPLVKVSTETVPVSVQTTEKRLRLKPPSQVPGFL